MNLGFSLLECLIVLSILAILLMMVSPNFQAGYHHIRLRMVANQIIHELNIARSEAISRQQTIRYCSDQLTGHWNMKRMILTEKDQAVHQFNPLPKSYRLIFKNSLGQNNSIHFLLLGFTREQRGSFYLVSPYETLRIVIGLSGRVRYEPFRGSDTGSDR
jgi:prepilin-type N-terminal cleavage/methylation domain-containing protein